MKKLLVFFLTFFVILPLPFTTISCFFNKKNNTTNLINWFDDSYPNYNIKSVLLDVKFDELYMFSGFSIDKVIYESYAKDLKANDDSFDYVIYSSQNHKFYDLNNLADDIYGFIVWTYVVNGDITSSLLYYKNFDYSIVSATAKPIVNTNNNATDFILHIFYDNGNDHIYYAKWVANVEHPTFKLISDNNIDD